VQDVTLREGFDAMDFGLVHAWLTATYWTPGIARERVERAARHSAIVLGAFADGQQVGYARAVSDLTRFAYLCDVVVAESHRGQGVGRMMVRHLLDHPDLAAVSTWTLATRDAHGVYAALGFLRVTDPVSRPEDWMVLRRGGKKWSPVPAAPDGV
jgi:GNAT superfamily N-acetyltransferase